MSFVDCIMSNTVLSDSQKKKIVSEYEKLVADNIKKFGPIDGPMQAAQRYTEIEVERLTLKKLNIARHVSAEVERSATVRGVDADAYKAQIKKAGKLGKFVFYKSGVAGSVMRNLERIGSYVGAEYEQNMLAIAKIANDYSSKTFGFTQDVQGFKDVVSEMRGVKTGNADAAKAAGQLSRLFKSIHAEYKRVGGVMGELPHYFPQRDLFESVNKLVQKHNGDRESAFKEFLADKMTWVDRKKMVNQKTGFAYNDDEFTAAVREVYDGMLDHGLYDAALASHRYLDTDTGAMAVRKQSSRFFHYKDADAFFANNAKYGNGDTGLFDNMVDYVMSMSRDTAIMRNLGPNPDLVILNDIAAARKDGVSPQVERTIQGTYDVLAGRNAFGGAVGTGTILLENTQNFLRAVQLAGAPVSAMSDSFFIGAAAKYNGLDATKTLQTYFATLNPLDSTDREIAKITAYVSAAVNANSLAHARMGDVSGTGVMRFMSNATHRLSGLGIMTDAARSAPVMQATGFFHVAKHAGVSFKDLPVEMREALGRWNIDEVGYGHIIQAESFVADASGASFIRPMEVAAINADTARNYAAWMYDMSQTASNEPRLLTRAITTGAVLGEAKRGTALRGISSSVMMYKSFGITVMLNHVIPSLQRGATEGKWGRAAVVIGVTPILAAATIQAKNVLYGKTPEDMTKPDFWRRAILASGTMGPFSDLAFGDATSYNYSPLEGLLGPVYGAGKDLYGFGMANLQKGISSDYEANWDKDAARLFQRYTPKFWYSRILQERLLYDQLNRMADPAYDSRMRRIENKMRQEKGQEFWWRPNQ